MTTNDKTFQWYLKKCHPCIHPYYLSGEDFSAKKKAEREGKDNLGKHFSNDLKVALTAIMTDADYKAFESQFIEQK